MILHQNLKIVFFEICHSSNLNEKNQYCLSVCRSFQDYDIFNKRTKLMFLKSVCFYLIDGAHIVSTYIVFYSYYYNIYLISIKTHRLDFKLYFIWQLNSKWFSIRLLELQVYSSVVRQQVITCFGLFEHLLCRLQNSLPSDLVMKMQCLRYYVARMS